MCLTKRKTTHKDWRRQMKRKATHKIWQRQIKLSTTRKDWQRLVTLQAVRKRGRKLMTSKRVCNGGRRQTKLTTTCKWGRRQMKLKTVRKLGRRQMKLKTVRKLWRRPMYPPAHPQEIQQTHKLLNLSLYVNQIWKTSHITRALSVLYFYPSFTIYYSLSIIKRFELQSETAAACPVMTADIPLPGATSSLAPAASPNDSTMKPRQGAPKRSHSAAYGGWQQVIQAEQVSVYYSVFLFIMSHVGSKSSASAVQVFYCGVPLPYKYCTVASHCHAFGLWFATSVACYVHFCESTFNFGWTAELF